MKNSKINFYNNNLPYREENGHLVPDVELPLALLR